MKNKTRASVIGRIARALTAAALCCSLLTACSSGGSDGENFDLNDLFGSVNNANNNTNGLFPDHRSGNNDQNHGNSRSFSIGDQQVGISQALYGADQQSSAIIVTGDVDGISVLLMAAAAGSFNTSETYTGNALVNEAEVVVGLYDPSTLSAAAGSTATGGISGGQLAVTPDGCISFSGTLTADAVGSVQIYLNTSFKRSTIENIRSILTEFNSLPVNNGGNTGGNTGGYTPMTCTWCKGSARCRDCKGDGSCHICVDGMTHCISCGGSRICQKCRGTGSCPYCEGDGILYN